MSEETKNVSVTLTEAELYSLSEFLNNENASMDDWLYDRIGRKVLVAAAKAGLYDEVDF